jgi:outer membrane protein OmpA-like peptidoglycan-associated protein
LVNLAAPAALGVIGKHASDNNLSAGGILRMLDSQKDRILSAVPSGLGLASALGIGNLGNIGSKITSALSGVTSEVKKKVNWLPILLTALALGLLIYFLTARKSDNNASTDIVSDTATTIIAPVETTAPATPTAPSIKVQLPDRTELDAFSGGIEDKLVMFLNDASSKADKDAWFDFDNLNFETGSATITPGSQQQVNNIAAILKAYPKVKIKVGGYTDRTGDAAINKKLSQDRADAVVAALKAAGANSAQLVGAEGYGSAFATVAAEASEEERKKDRRIAVSVREK